MSNKKQFVVASLSGTIYHARVLKDGTMSDVGREDVTEDVLRATNEWFIRNRNKMYGHKFGSKNAYVFHTTDEDKKERILKILMEEEE